MIVNVDISHDLEIDLPKELDFNFAGEFNFLIHNARYDEARKHYICVLLFPLKTDAYRVATFTLKFSNDNLDGQLDYYKLQEMYDDYKQFEFTDINSQSIIAIQKNDTTSITLLRPGFDSHEYNLEYKVHGVYKVKYYDTKEKGVIEFFMVSRYSTLISWNLFFCRLHPEGSVLGDIYCTEELILPAEGDTYYTEYYFVTLDSYDYLLGAQFSLSNSPATFNSLSLYSLSTLSCSISTFISHFTSLSQHSPWLIGLEPAGSQNCTSWTYLDPIGMQPLSLHREASAGHPRSPVILSADHAEFWSGDEMRVVVYDAAPQWDSFPLKGEISKNSIKYFSDLQRVPGSEETSQDKHVLTTSLRLGIEMTKEQIGIDLLSHNRTDKILHEGKLREI